MDTSSNAFNYNQNYCFNRLPCGYCKILEKPCPMQYNPTITYTNATNTCTEVHLDEREI